MSYKFKIDDKDLVEIVQGEERSLVLRLMDEYYKPIDFTSNTLVKAQFPKSDGIGSVDACSVSKTFASATDVSTTDNTLTITGHGLVNNEVVTLTTSDTLPTGLALATNYYVIVVDADTISLAATEDGDAIDITAVGTGTQTIVYAPLAVTSATLGKLTITLSEASTAALKAGEKQTIELEYTIAGVKRVAQLLKCLTVFEQAQ